MAYKMQTLVLLFLLSFITDPVESVCDFTESSYTFSVLDDVGAGAVVGILETNNPDEVTQIELSPTNPNFEFVLNNNHVELKTTASFENLDTVIGTPAAPSPTISLNGLKLNCGPVLGVITVNFVDTNNRPPEFSSNTKLDYSLKLPINNIPVNWDAPIRVTDMDYLAANNELTFTFASSDSDTQFEISEFTRRVTEGSRLVHYEMYFRISPGSATFGTKTITITASDGVTDAQIEVFVNIEPAEADALPPSIEYDDNVFEVEIDLSRSDPIPIATISDDATAVENLTTVLNFDDAGFGPFVNIVRVDDTVSLTVASDTDPAVIRANNYLLKFMLSVTDLTSKSSTRRFVLRFKKTPIKFDPLEYLFYLKEATSDVILQVSTQPMDPAVVFSISGTGVDDYLAINPTTGDITSTRTQEEIEDNAGKIDIFTVYANLDGEVATTMVVIVNGLEDPDPPTTTEDPSSSLPPTTTTDSTGSSGSDSTDASSTLDPSLPTTTTDGITSSGITDISDASSVTDMSSTTSVTGNTDDPSSGTDDPSSGTDDPSSSTDDPSSGTDPTGTDNMSSTPSVTESTNDSSSPDTGPTEPVTGDSTAFTSSDSTASVTDSSSTTSVTSPTSPGGSSPGISSTTSNPITSTTGPTCPPCPPDSCSTTTSIAPSTLSSSNPITTTTSISSTCKPCEDVSTLSTCPPCSCETTLPPDDSDSCDDDCDNTGYIAGICIMSAVTVGCIVATAFVVWKYVWLPQRSVYTPFRADLETGQNSGEKPRANSVLRNGTMNSTGLEKASSMKNVNGSLRSGPRGSFVSTGTSNGFVRHLDDDGGAFNSDPEVIAEPEAAKNFDNVSSTQPKEVYDVPYEEPTQRTVMPETGGAEIYDSVAPMTSSTASGFSPSSARDTGAIYDTIGSVDGEQAKEPKADYEGVKFDDEVKVIEHEPPPEIEGDEDEVDDEGNTDGSDSEDDDDEDSDENSSEEPVNGEEK